MKITEKQATVLRRLVQGWEIYNKHNHFTGKHGQTVYDSWTWFMENEQGTSSRKLIHHSTIRTLREKKLIDDGKPFNITELGESTIGLVCSVCFEYPSKCDCGDPRAKTRGIITELEKS